jgi:nitrogen fixation/metabolism regulation signal transduction histidine kinase
MISHDRRILLMIVMTGLPGVLAALLWLWASPWPAPLRATLALVIIVGWVLISRRIRDRLIRPFQTISNLLGALREGDYSIRARGAQEDDALGTVMFEINTLSDTLRTQRLGAQEATALLHAVMAEIDVAIFAFDRHGELALVNRYGEHLLGRRAGEIIGQRSEALGLEQTRRGGSSVLDIEFPGGSGRWEVRRRMFWQGGEPHELLVLSDVSEPLREQERQAWQRLIRVIGHELNNSLAPVKSIAGSLAGLLRRTPQPDDWREDMNRGLTVIESRVDALNRFTTAYTRLARLPAPQRKPVAFLPLIHRVAELETRLPIAVTTGPEVTISADPDQLEQLLINLLRNAVDAALETGGSVCVFWILVDSMVEVSIDDDGPGVPNTGNLFVPFFTTKPEGSGIGLVLSRQIAEAHGGTLTLQNREGSPGTRATLRLPRSPNVLTAPTGGPVAFRADVH